jgi:hypothetical protein
MIAATIGITKRVRFMDLLRFATGATGVDAGNADLLGDESDFLVDLRLVLREEGLLGGDVGERLLNEGLLLGAGLAGRLPREECGDA